MNGIQDFLYAFFTYLGICNSLKHCLVIQICGSRQVFIHSEFLGEVSYKSLELFTFFLGVNAIDPYLAVTLFQNAANDAYHGGFSGTIGSQQTEHTGPDFQGYPP